MQTTMEPRAPMARRLDPPRALRPEGGQDMEQRGRRIGQDDQGEGPQKAARRPLRRRPSRGPYGPVAWWERPAPDADEARWEAVQRIQDHRLHRGITVLEVCRRLEGIGAPLARATLSRILNGKQPTTWETVAALAEVLGVDVDLPGPGQPETS